MLKFLSTISVLFLLLPFFQTCSNERLINIPLKKLESNVSVKNQAEEDIQTFKAKWLNEFENSQKTYTVNSFELAKLSFEDFSSFILLLPINLFIIAILLQLYLAFKNFEGTVFLISTISILLLFIQFFILYFGNSFTDWKQIKIGAYCLILNQFYIAFLTFRKSLIFKKRPLNSVEIS